MLELVGGKEDLDSVCSSHPIYVNLVDIKSLWRYLATNHRNLRLEDVVVHASAYNNEVRFQIVWEMIEQFYTKKRSVELEDDGLSL